ncbi:hypothetical protein [Roseicella aquatilis]|uniref:DUF2029 domain-containing protein n=1 Tax=Roseicella aquatilis TaxID=2527868 RepID=A0A4R4D4Y1_9PROT|nr:hypothetical protein [Roseicella aquatilis]TCZ53929.1 hypothetical protein EXY23_23840 [Roseicella aquatilis]
MLLVVAWWLRVISLHPDLANPWWDWRIYQAALDIMASNGDPYSIEQVSALSATNMAFVTPPLPAQIMRWASWLTGPHVFGYALWLATVTSYFVCVVLLTKIIHKRLSPGLLALSLATSLAAFKGGGVQALLGANMSIVFHAAIITTIYYGLRDRRWTAFYMAVLVSAVFKPYFVLYLIFPVLLDGWAWKEFRTGCGVVVATALLYAAAALAFPDEQALFMRNLTEDAFEKLRFFGESAFNAGRVTFGDKMYGTIGAAVFAGLVLLSCLFWLPRHAESRIAALFCVAVILNPRVNHYDAFIAAIPMTYLIARAVAPYLKRQWASLPLASAGLVFVSFLYRSEHPVLTWLICGLLVAVLAVSSERLTQSNRVGALQEPAHSG